MESTIKPGIYLHYKGQYYRVYEVAHHSEDESLYVVYRPEYGEKLLWIRPLEMFCANVEVDGVTMPRFKFVKPLEES